MIKNDNINEESINAMKEFRKKQIEINIRLHIIFFILLLLLIILLIFFIIIYKSKISDIKSKTNKNSSSINSDKDFINKNENEIQHKVMNIIASSFGGNYHFSYILESSKEFQTIKKYIIDFSKIKNLNLNTSNIDVYFRYQGISDGDSFSSLKNNIDFSFYTLILIEAENNMRFGFFIEDLIEFEDDRFDNKNNNCFLFSFQKEGIYKCIGEKIKLKIADDEDGIIVLGDQDIIIKNNYLQYDKKLGVLNYPFKSFDVSTINKNIFTENNGEFQIRDIEIFTLNFNS